MISFVLLVVVFFIYLFYRSRRNYPPGPWSWTPIFGNMFLVKKLARQLGSLEAALEHLGKQYKTSVLGVKMAGNYTVTVFGDKLAKRVLLGKEFQARPRNYFTNLRSFGTNKGISMTDGELHQEQKSFLVKQLKDLGFGSDKMENLIEKEFKELLRTLGSGGENVDMSKILEMRTISVIWMFVSSEEIVSKCDLTKLVHLMNERSRLFDISGGTLAILPWLRFIAPDYCGYNLITKINQQLFAIMTETIKNHKDTYQKDITRDYIDAFLHQMYSSEGSSFTDDQLMMMCMDLFIAGLQTTAHTLEFCILYMAKYQNIQTKIQNELDGFYKGDRIPKFQDRANFPYLNAAISEVLRICHILPLYGPRRTLHDTTIEGYLIPKGSCVLIHMCSVNLNPETWNKPRDFHPERFLDPMNDNKIYPFAIGKRRCPGEVMAMNFITVFLAGILRFYRVEPVDGSHPPSLKPLSGITRTPQPYRLKLTRRKHA